jgi:hypothetical protein
MYNVHSIHCKMLFNKAGKRVLLNNSALKPVSDLSLEQLTSYRGPAFLFSILCSHILLFYHTKPTPYQGEKIQRSSPTHTPRTYLPSTCLPSCTLLSPLVSLFLCLHSHFVIGVQKEKCAMLAAGGGQPADSNPYSFYLFFP